MGACCGALGCSPLMFASEESVLFFPCVWEQSCSSLPRDEPLRASSSLLSLSLSVSQFSSLPLLLRTPLSVTLLSSFCASALLALSLPASRPPRASESERSLASPLPHSEISHPPAFLQQCGISLGGFPSFQRAWVSQRGCAASAVCSRFRAGPTRTAALTGSV